MTIVRSVVRSIVRPVIRGVIRSDLVQRYFTQFDSGVDSYGEPTSTPTITRIVMDVYPTNGNAGLPTGAPAVTNNIWQTIDFAFTGSLPDIGRNGAVYFDGYIGDTFAYNGATLVVNSPMDDAPSATYFNNLAAVLGSDELSISGGATWTEVDGVYTETGNFSSFLNLGGFSGESFVLTYSDATGNVRTNNGTLEEALSGSGQVVITSGAAAPRIVGASGATIKPLSLVRIPAATPLIIKRNIAEDQVENFTLHTDVSPNEWRNDDYTVILPVSGT